MLIVTATFASAVASHFDLATIPPQTFHRVWSFLLSFAENLLELLLLLLGLPCNHLLFFSCCPISIRNTATSSCCEHSLIEFLLHYYQLLSTTKHYAKNQSCTYHSRFGSLDGFVFFTCNFFIGSLPVCKFHSLLFKFEYAPLHYSKSPILSHSFKECFLINILALNAIVLHFTGHPKAYSTSSTTFPYPL